MGAIELGSDPNSLEVNISRHGDFVTNLLRTDEQDWDSGTVFTLVLAEEGFSWPTTLDGPRAGWNVDKATVDQFINQPKRDALLYYKVGSVELLIGNGLVRVHG